MLILRNAMAAGLLLAGAAGADCPPLLPAAGFVARDAAELRDYDQVELRAGEAGVNGYVRVAGAVCRQSYAAAEGRPVPADADVQAAYRAQLQKLGAEVVHAVEGQITARQAGAGGQRWLSIDSQPGEVVVRVVAVQPPRQVLTAPGAGDHRLIGHMPSYVADTPQVDPAGKFDFHVEDPAGDSDVPVSGHATHIVYRLAEGARSASDAEVAANYRQRLKELGAQFLSLKDDARTVARLEESGRAVWLSVYSQPGEISLFVVEEKPVQAKPEPTPAGTLRERLAKDGRVALYINFDFDKASLKPDAEPVLAEVAALLQADSGLQLAVEGHTDAAGTREYNQKLSAQRAAAVVQALERKGIAAGRLSSAGFGAARPLAGNDTAEGRARNRRVELVKR